MAEKLRILDYTLVGVSFSTQEWSDLSLATGLTLSISDQNSIVLFSGEYVAEAISFARAVPLGIVKARLEDIKASFIDAAREFSELFSYPWDSDFEGEMLTSRILDMFNENFEKISGEKLDFRARMKFFRDSVATCDLCSDGDLDELGIREEHLDILLSQLSEIFARVAGEGPQSKWCMKFIHNICRLIHEHMRQHEFHNSVFKTLNDVISYTLPDASNTQTDNVVKRIKRGRKLRKS